MTSRTNRWALVAAAAIALALGATAALGSEEDEEASFAVAELFFELNDTDGDLGIHALIDGDPWEKLQIEDPDERKMLDVKVKGRLQRQGLTELFFESAEPDFEELEPAEFFERFPAGTYAIGGRTLEGEELESEARLTHVLPAPPGGVTVNGGLAGPPEGQEDCAEEDLPEVSHPVVVAFDAVTTSHPDLGDALPAGEEIEILRYQVVAEWEDEDGNAFVTRLDLQPDDSERYSVTLPEAFFVDGTEVKFEVLVREASFNQTASESCPFEFVE